MYRSPRPPCSISLNRASWLGFSSKSAYRKDLAILEKSFTSAILRSTELHLWSSLLKAYRLMLLGQSVRLINRPALQGPMIFLIRSWSKSPFAFLMREYVDFSITPRKSRWSARRKKSWGMCSCLRVLFHLPRARNLHFWDMAVLCILHPEDISNKVITLSTNKNSHGLVMARFKLSQKAYRTYLVSMVGTRVI